MTGLSIVLGVILAIAICQGLAQAAEIRELEIDQMLIERALQDRDAELEELRCEYERSLGGTSYRWRPVNRIARRLPR